MSQNAVGFQKFFWIWNKKQGLTSPAFQNDVVQWLSGACRRERQKLLLLLFRGGGKSTICALYCAWMLYKNPDKRILIISGETSLASKMSYNVRTILEKHPLTKFRISKDRSNWAKGEFSVERDAVLRDPSVVARGVGANITGYRADLIICDDVEVPLNSDTQDKREKLRARLDELSFILTPGGQIIYLGTPHATESIYIADQQRPLKKHYLFEFEAKTIPVELTDGRSIWPERFSDKILLRLKNAIGPQKYQSQMLLQPSSQRKFRLNINQIQTYSSKHEAVGSEGNRIESLFGRRIVRRTCFWDISLGRSENGDACVIAHTLLSEDGTYFVSDLEYLSAIDRELDDDTNLEQLCRQACSFLSRVGAPAVHVETNGIGQFVPSFLKKSLNYNKIKTKVIGYNTSVNKKKKIINSFDPLLASRKLFFHQRVFDSQIIEEIRDWNAEKKCKEDGIDAIASCISIMPHSYGLDLKSAFMAPSDFNALS